MDQNNKLIHRFDNARDRLALQRRYGGDWQVHCLEKIPHQHDAQGQVSLTMEMTFEKFVRWLRENN